MGGILIDTNILVYVYDQRDAGRQIVARDLLLRLESQGAGRLSAQCIAEFANVVTRPRNHLMTYADALIQVQKWIRVFPVYPLTDLVVLEAVRGARDHQFSYYDAQIWAAARFNQVDLILSEDFQSGAMIEGVRFANPFAPDFKLEAWME
jgi:predicted nucleic acid-binding protein